MKPSSAQPVAVPIGAGRYVSGLVLEPAAATACFVFAHGAGAGMDHAFMSAFAAGMAQRGVASLRYQFPFMEAGSRRPDPPAVAHAAVRAAVAEAARRFPQLPLIAGGKSFGARMSSQAQAAEPLPGVVALAFVGFPLHPAGRSGTERAVHLQRLRVPMLFLQGTRDALADLALLRHLIDGLGSQATLALFDDADHAFHVRARSGRSDSQVLESMLDRFADWASTLAAAH